MSVQAGQMSPEHLLVAVDFSERARAALRRAVVLAGVHRARVTALYVAARSVPPDLLEVARDRLREEADAAADDSVLIDTAVVSGSIARGIVVEAGDRGADLIVLGAQGDHPVRDRILGSTAESVVHSAQVPVLIVKRPSGEAYSSVVLAVDDSEHAFHAAGFGMALTPDATHVLVHVAAVVGETLLRMHGVDEASIDQLRAAHVAEAVPRIERLRARFLPPDTSTVVVPGIPQLTVAEVTAQRHGDLVVVGTGGTSRLRDLVVGSVAQNTMRRVSCDVLIVRVGSRQADED